MKAAIYMGHAGFGWDLLWKQIGTNAAFGCVLMKPPKFSARL